MVIAPNTYKKDKITLVAPLLAADLLYGKEWVDEIIAPENFKPERKYDKVYDLDITRTGRSAIFKPSMDYFDIFEATYDISFGDRKKFPEIFKLNTIDSEKKVVDDLIERHSVLDGKNIILHCRGGKGRAGTIAAILLVEFSYSKQEAIDLVRARRKGAIESKAQEDFIFAYRAIN